MSFTTKDTKITKDETAMSMRRPALDASTESLASGVVDAAVAVHRELGPGLLESAYEACLAHELSLRGMPFRRQLLLPISYKQTSVDAGYRLDLVVDDRIILELKALNVVLPVHEAQLLTYLRLSKIRLGFLLNFNVPLMRDGIRRVVL